MSLLKSAHGGNTREAAELLGVSPEQLLDFSANINPLGMPAGLKRAIIDNMDCAGVTRMSITRNCMQRWRSIIRFRPRGSWPETVRPSLFLPW